jgi:hypothetical protein
MYYKGGSMLHMIRQLTGNDALWRAMLRGMNKTFYHQTVTDAQIRSYMSTTLKLNLAKVFEQYLETTKIPVLEYRVADGKLQYRWSNVVTGFAMPVDVRVLPNEPRPLQPGEVVDRLPASSYTRLRATEAWQTYPGTFGGAEVVVVNPDFYVTVKKVD